MAESNIDTTKLFSENGAPVADNQNTLTAGERGPMMLQDNWMIEKLAHFDREVIPERRMHAKGSGAFGTFKVTGDITKYTKAKVFEPGAESEVFIRFSTVAGERGAADAERDIRGFAMKFYTSEGNWDLVGNNTPVFFLRDPKKFIDLNHVVKRDPHTNMHSPQSNWDFWSSLPEALHQVTIVMSDRGIPASYRHMHGFGSHTFSLINENNERTWVKFHLRTQQGIKNLTDAEAAEIVAGDRESHQRDLFEAIDRGEFPKWTFSIQVMDEATAKNYKENPFDITKTWSHKEFPLIEVGELELNRNPENYFADVEQAAFNPQHLVPGIGLSPDKLLQGRLFAYGDAQRYRLGVNHNHIPVNRPQCPYAEFHRDGQMRVDGNYGGAIGYEPNSYGQWAQQPEAAEPPLDLFGPMDAWDPKDDPTDDTFYQPGALYRLMEEGQRAVLVENTARNMTGVTDNIKLRHAAHCYKADPEYGTRLAEAMSLPIDEVVRLAGLTHEERMAATGQQVPPLKKGGAVK
ncbi:catalase [Gordonibacter sp.]|uniref:catalase n=1 Tax=Gordonibacter sp. TaxID=1968902 RepID=UPI002FC8F073